MPTATTGTLVAYDGLTLFTRSWRQEEPPRGAALLVHGYAEHSGRYTHVATHLARRGYAVHAYDQRGYGRSEGRRAFVRAFGEYVLDLHDVLQEARRREARGTPFFLLGHSVGGLVSACYCARHRPRLTGLILSSPALCIQTGLPRIVRRLGSWIGRLAPTLPTTKLEHGTLSRDPAVVARTEADPLCYHGRTPARTGAELLRAGRWMRRHAEGLTLPLLCFHGTADRLTDPAATRTLYRHARSADRTLRLYEGFYHETMNDTGKERVLSDLASWLDART